MPGSDFPHVQSIFDPPARASGRSGFGIRGAFWSLAASGLTAFSNLPLRLGSALGRLSGSDRHRIRPSGVVIEHFVTGHDVPGLGHDRRRIDVFFSGVQLLTIGILGEYLGRVYDEVKRRPRYLVARRLGGSPFRSTCAAMIQAATPQACGAPLGRVRRRFRIGNRGAIEATLALIKLGPCQPPTSVLVDSPHWKAAAGELKGRRGSRRCWIAPESDPGAGPRVDHPGRCRPWWFSRLLRGLPRLADTRPRRATTGGHSPTSFGPHSGFLSTGITTSINFRSCAISCSRVCSRWRPSRDPGSGSACRLPASKTPNPASSRCWGAPRRCSSWHAGAGFSDQRLPGRGLWFRSEARCLSGAGTPVARSRLRRRRIHVPSVEQVQPPRTRSASARRMELGRAGRGGLLPMR